MFELGFIQPITLYMTALLHCAASWQAYCGKTKLILSAVAFKPVTVYMCGQHSAIESRCAGLKPEFGQIESHQLDLRLC